MTTKTKIRKPICPKGHKPDHFIVPLYYFKDGELRECEYSGAIHPDGEPCSCYWGGTYGVDSDDTAQIKEAEAVFCPECLSKADWK